MQLKNGQANIFNGLVVAGDLTLGSSAVNPTINFAAYANASTANFIINNASFGGTLLSFRNSADTRYVRITGINFDISTSGAISAGSTLNAGNISISSTTISGFNQAAIVMNGDTMSITNRNTATSTMTITSGGDILFQNRPSATAITIAKFAQTTGNFIIQSGGTITDNRYRLQVNGLSTDSGSLYVSGSTAMVGSGSTLLSIDGSSGRLFSVDDSLSGSLFSVNTAAGLPVMEAFSDNTVRIGQYGTQALFVSKSRVGIGIETPATTLQINGSLRVGSTTRYLDFTADSVFVTITSDNGNNYGVRLPKISLNDSNTQIRYASNGISIGSDTQSNILVIPNSYVKITPELQVTGSAIISGSFSVIGGSAKIGSSTETSTFTRNLIIANTAAATITAFSIFNGSTTGYTGFYIGESNTNLAFNFKYGSAVAGNWSGTSLAIANSYQIATGANNDLPMIIQGTPIVLAPGTTATNAGIRNDATSVRITTLANVHTSGTALLDVDASTTSRASLRIRSGSAPTSPNDGDIWFDGTNLKMQIGGVTKTFTMTP